MSDFPQFSFNTKWGRIYADANSTAEQIMAHGVPRETAEALLAIAHAAVKKHTDIQEARNEQR